MEDLSKRLASKSYQPQAEDRHAWLKAVEALVGSAEYHDRLQNAFDCLVDSAGDAKDAALLKRATELASEVVALSPPPLLPAWSCIHAPTLGLTCMASSIKKTR